MKKIFWVLLFLFLTHCIQASTKIKVACVGNSVTFGYLLNDPLTQSYPAQLQQMLGDKYVVENFGHSGATLLSLGHRPYIEQEAYKKALNFRADIVIFHLGLNDTDPRNYPNYGHLFTCDYINLINSFKKINPNVRVIIAQMSPITAEHPRFLAGTREWYRAIQPQIALVAQSVGGELISFKDPLFTRPNLLPDAIHPTRQGAKLLAEVAFKAITGNYGGLKIPQIYANNMVIDDEKAFVISGTANTGDIVRITFDKDSVIKQVGTDGKWEASFYPPYHKQNLTLTISTAQKSINIKNIKVGKVWLCSGQSNMEFLLKEDINFKKALKQPTDSNLCFFNLTPKYKTDDTEWTPEALDTVNNLSYFSTYGWQITSKSTIPNLSAVAYYYGKMLRDSLKIPIGLVVNAVGGSPTEAWIDRETLQDSLPQMLTDRFKGNHFAMPWVIERMNKNITKSEDKRQLHPYCPTYLFDTGIRPLLPYTFSGVIWYQGESNAHNPELHNKLFNSLVHSWRKNLNNRLLPFFFVQLPTINRPSWGEFRYQQYLLSKQLEHIGMAVSLDCGDSTNVHPTNKQPIGTRLALLALKYLGKNTYEFEHFKGITASGATPAKATVEDNEVIVAFKNCKKLHTKNNKPLVGFEIADADLVFYPAIANIRKDNVHLVCSKVKNAKWVRYAYQPFNHANLLNEVQLPTPTFVLPVSTKISIYVDAY